MTKPITKEDRLAGAREALLNYQQADQDGIMVITSRQAIHEVNLAVTALKAENARLRKLLKDCAEDLEAEIEARYANMHDYPTMLTKYERDMSTVYEARKALNGE